MPATTEPYPECEKDARQTPTATVHNMVERFDHQDIDDWITGRVKAEECACRCKSPVGGCCLGNVRGAIQEAQGEFA